MGPAFANQLEDWRMINMSTFKVLSLMISIWHTCGDHYHGSKVIDL